MPRTGLSNAFPLVLSIVIAGFGSPASARSPIAPNAAQTVLVYVADESAKTVSIFTLDGTLHGKLTGFKAPNSVAVGPDRRLYVLDDHATIDVFRRNETKPFERLTPPSNYAGLIDVTVGFDGTIYVSNAYASDMSGNGIWVYPPGAKQPTLMATPVSFVEYLASDRSKNLFASFFPYSFDPPGVLENLRSLGFDMVNPAGLGIAADGDIVVCDSSVGIETYKPGRQKPSSTIHVACGDISLAAHDSLIYVTTGSNAVTRYTYPSGAVSQTLRGFKTAVAAAVDGAISD